MCYIIDILAHRGGWQLVRTAMIRGPTRRAMRRIVHKFIDDIDDIAGGAVGHTLTS